VADIFISYTSSDRDWAFWIGQELEKLGHAPHIHEWEISAGGNIPAWIEERHDKADHILLVISAAYLSKDYSSWERQAAQWAAASKRPNFALPVFIEACEPPTLLAPLKRCDLYGIGEEAARVRLGAYLAPAAKPAGPMHFPGEHAVPRLGPTKAVPFPGRHFADEPTLQSPPKAKPIIFVSYAHGDEPEKPIEGEVQWLSFVMNFLRPAAKQGAVEVWVDQLVRGGEDWEFEIERRLRACDIFILLVSPRSMSSNYIVDKEIAIIRERQEHGERVHFYPLLLTPTPKIGLDLLRDTNLRPRDAKPFSDYTLHDRYAHMADAADEIACIAAEIAARKNASDPGRVVSSSVQHNNGWHATELEIKDQDSLSVWLGRQNSEVSVAIAARSALRVAPLAAGGLQKRTSKRAAPELTALTLAIFRSGALARVSAKYPGRANELRAAAALAARAAATVAATANSPTRAAARAAAFAAADAAACAAAASDTEAAAYAAADAASATAYAFAAAAYASAASPAAYDASASANASAWEEIRSDVAAFGRVGGTKLADSPLWSKRPPSWAESAWSSLQAVLPRDENWEVWISWYEDRLRGGSRGEDYEIVIADVPPDVWKNGPAMANAWIREHLP
jgi:hypothetical protein